MSTSAPFRPEPINRINAEREDDDEAEHQVAEQHNLIRRCYVSESIKHFVGNRENMISELYIRMRARRVSVPTDASSVSLLDKK